MSALDRDGQMLNTARATIAQMAEHTSVAVALACAVVEEISDDQDEVDEATALREMLEPVSL